MSARNSERAGSYRSGASRRYPRPSVPFSACFAAHSGPGLRDKQGPASRSHIACPPAISHDAARQSPTARCAPPCVPNFPCKSIAWPVSRRVAAREIPAAPRPTSCAATPCPGSPRPPSDAHLFQSFQGVAGPRNTIDEKTAATHRPPQGQVSALGSPASPAPAPGRSCREWSGSGCSFGLAKLLISLL